MSFVRSSGILLHLTSLPGKFGIGDLGHEAYAFADFLLASGQTLWQVLPLGPTGYGDSPYQSFSAFAGNSLLISPELLADEGLLSTEDLNSAPQFPVERVDYGAVIEWKHKALQQAFQNFRRAKGNALWQSFETFCQSAATWLDDYALFRALKDKHGGAVWNDWDKSLARRDPEALSQARAELSEEIEARRFYQFLFFRQWTTLKSYCNGRGIKIVGDIPIFVAYDSADVWTQPELFKLDGEGRPRVVAGVPPDYFSATGQLWGNPIYDWERMRADGFQWWVARMRATLEAFDMVRLDHFRGFAACWEIPAGAETAQNGRWVEAPGREIFQTLQQELGELPLIAEDLGVITPDVDALRVEFGFPSMRILQMGFYEERHLPHNYERKVAVYTGTHDNDTTVGWFNSQPGAGSTRSAEQIERERDLCLRYLDTDGREIHWDFIRAAFASVAGTAIVPLQDVLGLGTEARMNLPATTSGNWQWRYRSEDLTDKMRDRLRELSSLYERLPATAAV